MAQLNGKDLNLYVRENGSTGAYKKMVCETNSGVEISTSTTETVTKCATYSSTSTPSFTFPIDAVLETAPSATEVSFEECLSYIFNSTLLDVKFENPVGSGTNFFIQGTARISALSISAPAEGLVSFTGTLTGTGTFDITP